MAEGLLLCKPAGVSSLFILPFPGIPKPQNPYTTSGGGKFTTKEYPCGTDYSIREISPSEGYLLDETVYPVGAEPGNFTLEHNSIPMTATEDVVLGSIAITKHTDQPAIPEQDAPAPETESPTEEEAIFFVNISQSIQTRTFYLSVKRSGLLFCSTRLHSCT